MVHDPGGKVRLPLPFGMSGGADFSACGRYRRTLWRKWDDMLAPREGYVLFIGMNPSTADADVDDPTIRREIGHARRWGFKHLVKCNIGDYRATDPRDLPAAPEAACTLDNLIAVERAALDASLIVMAHGVPPAPLLLAARQIAWMLTDLHSREVYCLGTTKGGFPKHPLYLRGDADLITYQGDPK